MKDLSYQKLLMELRRLAAQAADDPATAGVALRLAPPTPQLDSLHAPRRRLARATQIIHIGALNRTAQAAVPAGDYFSAQCAALTGAKTSGPDTQESIPELDRAALLD